MPTNNDYLNTQREKEYSSEIETSSNSLLGPISAGLGAIVLGLNIFGKTKGRGLIADVIHFLGHPSYAGLSKGIDKLAKNSADYTTPTTTKTAQSIQFNTATKNVQIGPVDLIDELKNTIEILGSTRIDIATKIAARTVEKINRDTTRLGPFSSFYGPSLKRISVGDILSEQSVYRNAFNKEQLSILQQAAELRLVSKDTILDKNILTTSGGGLRDVRLSRMLSTGKNGGLIGRITGGLDLFGQANVLRSIVGTNVGVATLGPTDYVKGNRFFIGGTVYGYDKWGMERVLSVNQKLRLTGDPLDAVTAARQGNLRISRDKLKQAYAYRQMPKAFKQALINLEERTGVGLGFANRPSVVDRFIVNPYLRFKALAEGNAIVYRHRYTVEGHSSKLLDVAVGSDVPELITNRGVIRSVAGGGTQINWAAMPLWQKVAAIFDLQSGVSVLKRSSFESSTTGKKVYTLSNKDLVVPLPEGGLENLTKSIKGRLAEGITHSQVGIVTQAGDFVNVVRPKYYNVERSRTVPFLTNLQDTLNYLFYRTNSLASETLLGIGFAPGKTPLGSAIRLASIPFVYEAGRELLEYGDYLSEKTIGVSPSKLLSDIYAQFRVGQQKVREVLGIQQSLSWLEENFPGSVDSEGSTLARSILAPLAMAVGGIGKLGMRKGIIAAGLTALAVGGPSPGQSSKELEEEYRGDRKVPVRKGRFWGSGFSPFFGAQPEYFDYSWYYKLKNDLDYRGLYGSKDEYFNYHQNVFGVPLPTPSNYFGLNNLANPYRWEQNNYYSRPYVQTGSPLENFPIFGPLLSATVGRALKPTMYRPSELPLLKAGIVDKGLQPSVAQMLGIPAMAASEQQIEDPNDPMQRLKKMGDVATEPFGVYKFVMEYFGASLSPSGGPRYASSDVATSEGRQFYSQSLGGGFYQTELLRRFMLSEYSTTHNLQRLLNPIRNQMQTFLPGSFSDNAKDRTYMKDFHMGDPFCLRGDSYVEQDGLKFTLAKDIKTENTLISCKGEATKVMATAVRESGPIKEIQLATLPDKKIYCSEDHPFLVRTLVKGRTRKSRIKLYLYSNQILSNCTNGSTRISISEKAGVYYRYAHECWKLLEEHKKVRIHRKGKHGTVEIIDNTLFDLELLKKGLQFKEAKDLSVGDYVAYPIPTLKESVSVLDLSLISDQWSAVTENYVYYNLNLENAKNLEFFMKERSDPGNYSTLWKAKKYSTKMRYKRYIPLDSSFGFFVGLWCAEGCVSEVGDICTAHHIKEKEVVIKAYKDIGLGIPRIKENGNSLVAGKGCLAISRAMTYLCGNLARSKSLNDLIYLAPKEFIRSFLDGLFFGDGCEFMDRNRHIKSLKTSSEILALQVRKLLLGLGIVSSIVRNNPHTSSINGEPIIGGYSWNVKISLSQLEGTHKTSWFVDDKYYYFRINNITQVEDSITYGFMTDTGTFCVPGAATHNTLIPKGEYRLPGKLYEEINKLHSGTPGVYDYLDQFLILSDVAPYSDSYRRLEKQVKDKLELKQIEPEWEQKVISAMSQRKQVIGVDNRYPRIEDQLANINQGIKQEAMSSAYVSARKAYDFLTHDVLAEIPYLGSKLFPFRSPYEQYRKQFVEGAEYSDWDRPYESILRPMYYDMALEDPLTAGMKGSVIGALTYGPMRFFVPFMGIQSNLSKNILMGGIAGAAISTERILGGKSENYIPQHVVDEANFYEYADKFTYLKARMYEDEARRLGEPAAASQFSRVQRKTMVGANNSIMMKAALPRSVDRRYFDYFASQEGFSEAQLNGLPEYMSVALERTYAADFPSKDQADQDVIDYFSANPLPATNFMGWHPSVPSQAVRMKLVKHGLNGVSDNMHRFGFFESQQNELENRLPDLHNSSLSFIQPIKFSSMSNTAQLLNNIRSDIQTSLTTTPYRATNDITITRNRTFYIEDLMR